MKKLLLIICISCCCPALQAQSVKTDIYDLIKKLLTDSSGYPNVGDWDVSVSNKIPIKWKGDRLEMSDDTSINFFMLGTIDLAINGRSFTQNNQPVKWSIMLKGPRMGYTNFSIVSSPSGSMQPKYNIDSLFGKKNFKSKLIKGCDAKPLTGFYFYEIKLPKKDLYFIKISWITVNGNTALRIDCFDERSRYAAKLDCR